jgi:siroheme synthase
VSSSFAVLTGHMVDYTDWRAVSAGIPTLVVLMAGKKLPEIVGKLQAHGWAPDTPVRPPACRSPLTHRAAAGCGSCMASRQHWQWAPHTRTGTGARRVDASARRLQVAVIRDAGGAEQQHWQATLASVVEATAGVTLSPCIVVVGRVAALPAVWAAGAAAGGA